MIPSPRILIAGIGNIFLGDDAFGVEVAQRLSARELPPEARVVDFGIRGLDLMYALLDGYDTAVLVDATPRGGTPGTLYVIEPDASASAAAGAPSLLTDTHALDPAKVLGLAAAMGSEIKRVLVVGCEPDRPEPDEEMQMGLSPPVRAAVDEAVPLIESLVAKILGQAETV